MNPDLFCAAALAALLALSVAYALAFTRGGGAVLTLPACCPECGEDRLCDPDGWYCATCGASIWDALTVELTTPTDTPGEGVKTCPCAPSLS